MRRLDHYVRSTERLTEGYRAWLPVHCPLSLHPLLQSWVRLPWPFWEAEHHRGLQRAWAALDASGEASNEDRFQWRLVRDQALLVAHGQSASEVLDEISVHNCFPREIQNALWSDERHEEGAPLTRLLIKVLPHKCKRRQFGPQVLRLLNSADVTSRSLLLTLVAMALLGNLRRARTVPASDAFRLMLYRAVRPSASPADREVLERLVRSAPLLVALVGREYVLSMMGDLVVLRRHACAMFAVDSMHTAMAAAMDKVRGLVEEAFLAQPNGADWVARVRGPVLQLCEDSHHAILPMCYPRGRASFFHEVNSLRLPGPLPSVNRHISQALGRIVASLDPQTHNDERAATAVLTRLELLGCSYEATRRLVRLQQRFDRERWGKRAFKAEVLRHLYVHFPLALAIVRLAVQLWRLHSDGRVIPLPSRWRLAQARALHLRLVQRTAEGAEDAAWQGRLVVAEESTWLYLCHVCGTIYSRVRRPSARRNTYLYGLRRCGVQLLSDQVEPFCIGRNQTMGHMRCGDLPLLHVSLLGALFVFRRVVYFLCTGVACGAIGRFCTRTTVCGPSGFLCSACSAAVRLEALERFLFVSGGLDLQLRTATSRSSQHVVFAKLQCCLCKPKQAAVYTAGERRFVDSAVRFASTQPHQVRNMVADLPVSCLGVLFVYPGGALLCKRHHRDYQMGRAATTRLALVPSKKEICNKLWGFRQAYIESRNESQRVFKRRRVH